MGGCAQGTARAMRRRPLPLRRDGSYSRRRGRFRSAGRAGGSGVPAGSCGRRPQCGVAVTRPAVTLFRPVSQHLLCRRCGWRSQRAPLCRLSQLGYRVRHSERRGGRRAAAAPATAVTAANSGNHSAQSWRHCTVLAGCGGCSAARRGALRSAPSFPAGCTESLILAVRRRRDALGAPVCAVALPVQWASETAAAVPIRSLSVAELGGRAGAVSLQP